MYMGTHTRAYFISTNTPAFFLSYCSLFTFSLTPFFLPPTIPCIFTFHLLLFDSHFMKGEF